MLYEESTIAGRHIRGKGSLLCSVGHENMEENAHISAVLSCALTAPACPLNLPRVTAHLPLGIGQVPHLLQLCRCERMRQGDQVWQAAQLRCTVRDLRCGDVWDVWMMP